MTGGRDTVVDDMERRQRVRRSLFTLVGVALAFYVTFILWTVTRH